MSMVKSATNAVFAEVALLEPFGLFRTVALAWTEGLNTCDLVIFPSAYFTAGLSRFILVT
jgi:hypothetical protein